MVQNLCRVWFLFCFFDLCPGVPLLLHCKWAQFQFELTWISSAKWATESTKPNSISDRPLSLCIPKALPSHQVLSRLAAVLQISISTLSALHYIAELAVAWNSVLMPRLKPTPLHRFYASALSVQRPPRRQDKPWWGRPPTLLLRASITTYCTAWRRPR